MLNLVTLETYTDIIDLVVLKVILKSLGAIVTNWTVFRKRLVVEL